MGFIKRLAIATAVFIGMIILTGFVSGIFRAAVGEEAREIAILAGVLAAAAAGLLYLVRPGLFRPFAPPGGGAWAFFKRLAGALALFLAVVIVTALLAGILRASAGGAGQEAVAVIGVLAALAAGVFHLIRPGLRRTGG
ncbi:MAG: hypothetical protein HYZ11_08695 [Candidatus Tectomicrobia bacterium]|uniref:Uncharacterized protein n=1 Tax=Tectimicrobiota bacterium TaxID=2528274 RepID=A0A932HXS6_UNCTE|nr:hypothetical protein [Candidatus Tectomicrobia bacterium]